MFVNKLNLFKLIHSIKSATNKELNLSNISVKLDRMSKNNGHVTNNKNKKRNNSNTSNKPISQTASTSYRSGNFVYSDGTSYGPSTGYTNPANNRRRYYNNREESIVGQNNIQLLDVNPWACSNTNLRYYSSSYNVNYVNPFPLHHLCNTLVQTNLSRNYFHRQPSQPKNDRTPQNKENVDVVSLRRWENTSKGKPNNREGFNFKIMTYNVLAQDLLTAHPELYRYHNSKNLEWTIRWNNIYNEIRGLNPDIFCLQEVQESNLNQYVDSFQKLGFHNLYKRRTGDKPDGCAIFYKKDVLKFIDSTSLEYRHQSVPVLDRDNIAIIAKFAPIAKLSKEFVVATTHLLYNPKREDVRLAQVQLLLSEIEKISFKKMENETSTYIPVIITGDFNSPPYSAIYNLITKGYLKYDTLAARTLKESTMSSNSNGKLLIPARVGITDNCQNADSLTKRISKYCDPNTSCTPNITYSSGLLSHNFAFKSVYSHKNNGNVEGTTFQNEWVTVDYIFYSGQRNGLHVNDDQLQLLSKYRLPTEKELQDTKIPNEKLGSDHLSLLAKFKLLY